MAGTTEQGVSTDLAGLGALTGQHLGFTPWREMTQDEVDRFADLTRDHNFIHVDPQRAAETPFKGTIAHGFFSLALTAAASQQITVTDAATGINYGLDKVRFPAPLPVGSRWRTGAEVIEVSDIPGGAQLRLRAAVEVEGSERPACVAESIVRFYA